MIVGASGNLGSHIARHLLKGPHQLRLFVHKAPLPHDLVRHPNVTVASGDLDDSTSLPGATAGIHCIVYVAGVLFRARPQRFLHRTNTIYVQNLVNISLREGVERFILISFPHIEENTTPDSPATGRLDVQPGSIHARTRLEAEKYLFGACKDKPMTPLVLRAGVIYGRDVKLIEAARSAVRTPCRLEKPYLDPSIGAARFLAQRGNCDRTRHSFRHLQSLRRLSDYASGIPGCVGGPLGLPQTSTPTGILLPWSGGFLRDPRHDLPYTDAAHT